jgi:hypothetical protein
MEKENIVSDIYDGYHETQKEILAIELRKTRNQLFAMAFIIFLFDLLAITMSGLSLGDFIGWILIVPAIIVGLAFLASKEPMLSMIIATIIIVGLWTYSIVALGGKAAVTGWLGKAIIIYFIFAGFQNARTAQRIKKELKI